MEKNSGASPVCRSDHKYASLAARLALLGIHRTKTMSIKPHTSIMSYYLYKYRAATCTHFVCMCIDGVPSPAMP